MEDKLHNILKDYKENEKKIDSIQAIFRLFITDQPNGELLISFMEQLKYKYPECKLRDIDFIDMFQTIKEINN